MYYVQFLFGDKFRTVSAFPNYDKALRYVKQCVFIHDISCKDIQIVHRGLVLSINENSLKKAFK